MRPRRAEHDLADHLEVDLARTAAAPATAGCSRSRRAPTNAKSNVVCDALILDEDSRSDTYPYIEIDENEVDIGHEATVSKIGDEQLFYLMSRGLSRVGGVAR